jgi:hypothetical protein
MANWPGTDRNHCLCETLDPQTINIVTGTTHMKTAHTDDDAPEVTYTDTTIAVNQHGLTVDISRSELAQLVEQTGYEDAALAAVVNEYLKRHPLPDTTSYDLRAFIWICIEAEAGTIIENHWD